MTQTYPGWVDRDQPVFTEWLKRQIPDTLTRWYAQYPFLALVARTLILLGTFVALKRLVSKLAQLPADSYRQPLLFVEILSAAGPVIIFAATLLLVLLLRFGAPFVRWDAFDNHIVLRRFIFFLAAILTWPLVTLGYNYFFEQGYYLDKLLLISCLLLVWWRPIFVLPFSFLALAVLWQTMEPPISGTSHIPHKRQLLLVLELFGAAVILRATLGIKRMDTFWLLVCCLVAAVYWEPAVAKLKLNWVDHGHLYRMPLAAHAHGWLAFVDPARVVEFAKLLAPFDLVMRLFVLALETGCLGVETDLGKSGAFIRFAVGCIQEPKYAKYIESPMPQKESSPAQATS